MGFSTNPVTPPSSYRHPVSDIALLGLEEAFDVEFPERMLNRKSFASIDAIGACIAEIAPLKAVA